MTLAIGTRLGPYEILAALGAGGMGEVYRAKDTRLDRSVAVKVLPSHFTDDPERRARFEREARAVSSLNHPHICTLYDVGQEQGADYLVMELVEGETLAERLRKGALPLDQTYRTAIEIADALEKAHRQGVIHRDLKPGNVMLTKAGSKLMDFGLAKVTLGVDSVGTVSALPTAAAPLTGQGTLLGTIPYMAPEQLEGKEADARSDLWAFGCLLYEMVTGRRAFEGKSQASLISAIMGKEPQPIAQLQPLTPPALERLVRVCLAKDPDDRLQTAHDVMQELKWIAEAPAVSQVVARGVPIPVAPRRARFGLVAVGLALLAGVALGGLAVWRTVAPVPATRDVSRFAIPLPMDAPVDPTERSAIAFAPDGKRLVYVARVGVTTQLYVRALDTLGVRPIPGTVDAVGPFFSPDGAWLGFFAKGRLMKVPADGGIPSPIGDAPLSRGASWGEDGRIVFSSAPGTGLWRVPASGGVPEPVTQLDPARGERTHRWPSVLPGSRFALFTQRTGDHASFDDVSVSAVSLDSGETQFGLERGTQPHYVPTRHLAFARGSTLHAVAFDLTRLAVTGAAVQLVEGVMTDPSTGAVHYSVSSTGSLAYVPGQRWRPQRFMRFIDRTGKAKSFDSPRGVLETPRLSPNGRRIAVTMVEASDSVWVFDLATRQLSRLTYETGSNRAPVWSPDGRRLAFGSNASGAFNLYWTSADGSQRSERLTTSPNLQLPSSWSPDGRFLAFTEQSAGGGSDILTITLQDGRRITAFLRTPFNEYAPAFSPNGRWLAYVSDHSGRPEVYVQSFLGPSEKRQLSTDGGGEPSWSASGSELLYRSGDAVVTVPFSQESGGVTGQARTLFRGRFKSGDLIGLPNYSVSPDGGQFVMIEEPLESMPRELQVVLNWVDEVRARLPVR